MSLKKTTTNFGGHSDEAFMRRALVLARRGLGKTRPNPVVGALVVRDGKIAGRGWHERSGGPHAESLALDQAGEQSRGATMFVTLEPCNHTGRTGPCTERILASGIKRVVVAMRDLNPKVAGGGIERLRAAGLEVVSGVCEAEAEALNSAWTGWLSSGLPEIVLKLAVTEDGAVTLRKGSRSQLSGAAAQAWVQRRRAHSDAILIGSGTALIDDPLLSNRTFSSGAQPFKVILDSHLRLSPSARLLQEGRAIVVTAQGGDEREAKVLEDAGAEVLSLPDGRGRVDLRALAGELGGRGFQRVLCEGGAELAESLVVQGLVSSVVLFRTAATAGPGGLFFHFDPAKLKLRWSRRIGQDNMLVFDPEIKSCSPVSPKAVEE